MNREDIQKLLGGYATDTLTPEEQQVLFEAALDDQELFDALAREQSLRDLLRGEGAKAQLLAVLNDRPLPWYARLVAGWRPLAAAAVMAGVTTVAVVALRHNAPPKRVIISQASPPLAEAQPAPPAPVARQFDSPVSAVVKESPPKPQAGAQAGGQHAQPEDDRRAKLKETPEQKRTDAADSLSAAPTLPRAEPVAVAGSREGAAALGGSAGGNLRAAPTGITQPVLPPRNETFIAGFRDTNTKERGSVVGALAPGAAAPPATAAPKAEESAKVATVAPQQQGQQAQFGVQSAQSPQFQQTQQQASQLTVNVQPSNAPLEATPSQNAQTLFYGTAVPSKDLDKSAAETQTKASALKKTAQPADQEKAQRQAIHLNGISGSGTVVSATVANPGVRYSLRRKTANGAFQQVDPNNLKSGDTIELELIPNESGFLMVRGRGSDGTLRQLLSRSVERLKKYVVAPLKSGEKELLVSFRRQPVVLTGAALSDEKSRVNATQATADATYVVGDPAAPQVDFTITLTYK